MRAAGLLERLRSGGLPVEDRGDVAKEIFAVDHEHPKARNLPAALRAARAVAEAVAAEAAASDKPLLVLGGDCTITLGVVAGLGRVDREVGLVYFDGDADLSSPESGGSGVLDSMGVSHLLGLADTELARLAPRQPMLSDDRLVLLGYDDSDPDSHRDAVLRQRPGLARFPGHVVRAHPRETARAALEAVHAGSSGVIVHFDVDVVDSGDLPLGNFPHYSTGVPLAAAGEVLSVLCASPRLRALVLTEVNPSYDPDGEQIDRYVSEVARALTRRWRPAAARAS